MSVEFSVYSATLLFVGYIFHRVANTANGLLLFRIRNRSLANVARERKIAMKIIHHALNIQIIYSTTFAAITARISQTSHKVK